MRPKAAWAGRAEARQMRTRVAVKAAQRRLFISESLDRIEMGGAGCGIQSRDQADDNCKCNCAERQPERHGGDIHGGKIPVAAVDIRPPHTASSDEPA